MHPRGVPFAAAAAVATAIVLIGVLGSGGTGTGEAIAASDSQRQPNVVLLLSDDQTLEEMRFMPRVQRLIGARGATFPTTVTNWPLCCPARATLQSGQYAHNHGVLGNGFPLGGFENFNRDETLPVWLQRAGYYTAHIGKLVNGYEHSDVGVPPGWSEWHGSKDTYRFYGFALFENGAVQRYGEKRDDPYDPLHPELYNTDVYTEKAVDIIQRRAPRRQPFYLSLSYLAPHNGAPDPRPDEPPGYCGDSAKPAIRHMGSLADRPVPRPPSFNEDDVSDKPSWIATDPKMRPAGIAEAKRNYRCRGESLFAVDEGARAVVRALRDAGELDDTLLIYTSDNGFFHGEHRIRRGKNRVYEEAVRVPLLMRGPGIPAGVEVRDLASNADLPKTILDAAGARAGLTQDGRSLLPLIAHPERRHGRELLIEQLLQPDRNPRGARYTAVRTTIYKYVEYANGEIELYDLQRDPYELENVRGRSRYAAAEAALAERLALLRDCAGRTCRSRPAVRLRLPDPRAGSGQRCVRAGRVRARIRNRSGAAVVRAAFRVERRRAGTVRSAPFSRRIPPRLLRRHRKPVVAADVELVDGRVVTVHERIRICRRR